MILYLISELDVGGAEKSLFHLVMGLDRERFGDPVVACLWGKGRVGQWFEDAGVEVIYLSPGKAGLLPAGLRLRRILKSGRFKLFHTFLFHANFVGRLAAIGTGVPVVSSIRVTEVDRPFRVTLDRLTNRFVVAETCVAEAVRRWSIERGLPAEKLVTIPNGVDVSAYKADRGKLHGELDLPAEARIALFLGRLSSQKGPDILLDAAAALCHRMPELHFILAGDGPLRGKLHMAAEREGLLSQIHFMGRRDDVAELLADADLLVLPSRWEGMPNAVLEAMAAARPVVATDVGGCPELVADGQTGLIVPQDDAAALADAIEKIISDPDLGREMGAAGRERAQREFPIEKMVRMNEQLYEKIVSKNTGAA